MLGVLELIWDLEFDQNLSQNYDLRIYSIYRVIPAKAGIQCFQGVSGYLPPQV